jgi:hypothetical protein
LSGTTLRREQKKKQHPGLNQESPRSSPPHTAASETKRFHEA